MEKQDFLNSITEIGTCDDEIKRRELLAALSDEVSKDYDTMANLTETNASLTTRVSELKEANYDLFLRTQTSKTPDEVKKDETGIDDKPKEKRKFENLFDEKGGIK